MLRAVSEKGAATPLLLNWLTLTLPFVSRVKTWPSLWSIVSALRLLDSAPPFVSAPVKKPEKP